MCIIVRGITASPKATPNSDPRNFLLICYEPFSFYLPNSLITKLRRMVSTALSTRQVPKGRKNWTFSCCRRISPGSLPRNGTFSQNTRSSPTRTADTPRSINSLPKGSKPGMVIFSSLARIGSMFALFPLPDTILSLSAGYCQIQSARIVN